MGYFTQFISYLSAMKDKDAKTEPHDDRRKILLWNKRCVSMEKDQRIKTNQNSKAKEGTVHLYRLGRKMRQCKGNEWVGEKDVQLFFIFAFFNLTPPPLRAYSLISFP